MRSVSKMLDAGIRRSILITAYSIPHEARKLAGRSARVAAGTIQ
jgi:hypothetical protein